MTDSSLKVDSSRDKCAAILVIEVPDLVFPWIGPKRQMRNPLAMAERDFGSSHWTGPPYPVELCEPFGFSVRGICNRS